MTDNSDHTDSFQNEQTNGNASQGKPNQKKPYSPPASIKWGSLRDITQSVGSSGRNDGGRGRRRRTRW